MILWMRICMDDDGGTIGPGNVLTARPRCRISQTIDGGYEGGGGWRLR